MSRVLWISDPPALPTGFAMVTRAVGEGLERRGHVVRCFGGGPARLREAIEAFAPDVVITLTDVWLCEPLAAEWFRDYRARRGARWLAYLPLDGDAGGGRLPPGWLELLAAADVPVAMSRYGRDLVAAGGLTCACVPHGVDTRVFRPAPRAEDGFVVLSDARNQPRKMLPRLLTIFERFARGKPDVRLHLHCDPRDPAASGRGYRYRIDEDVRALGLAGKVRFTRGFSIQRGLAVDALARVYAGADVHLLTSLGEGFGLPTLQAAAAGLVPLAPAHSASRELVEGHGEAIAVAGFVTDGLGIRRALVDVDDAVARLEALYADRRARRARAARAREFAVAYDWERIVPAWDALVRGAGAAPGGVRLPGSTLLVPVRADERLAIPAIRDGAARVYVPPGAPRSKHLVASLHVVFPSLRLASSLAGAVLAIDVDGVAPGLRRAAAEAGVPLVDARGADAFRRAREWLVDPLARARVSEERQVARAAALAVHG